MIGIVIVAVALIGGVKLAGAVPRLVASALAIGIAALLYMRKAWRDRQLAQITDERAATTPTDPWRRIRCEQRLLNAMTREALSATHIVTEHPRASATGFAIAARLLGATRRG